MTEIVLRDVRVRVRACVLVVTGWPFFCQLYEGGFFKAKLEFPKDFPNNPPVMTFVSEMFHPNGESSSGQTEIPRFSKGGEGAGGAGLHKLDQGEAGIILQALFWQPRWCRSNSFELGFSDGAGLTAGLEETCGCCGSSCSKAPSKRIVATTYGVRYVYIYFVFNLYVCCVLVVCCCFFDGMFLEEIKRVD